VATPRTWKGIKLVVLRLSWIPLPFKQEGFGSLLRSRCSDQARTIVVKLCHEMGSVLKSRLSSRSSPLFRPNTTLGITNIQRMR
jgi:hypothetical protein